MTDTKKKVKRPLTIEEKRSNVRRFVTYWSIGAYLVLASIVIVWLMWAGRYEVAIGVLGGVASLAGSIAGFWFGARKPTDTEGKTKND